MNGEGLKPLVETEGLDGEATKARPEGRPSYDDLLSTLREQRKALEAEWQPIETAPKDGSILIGASFGSLGDLEWVSDIRWLTTCDVAELDGLAEPEEWTEPGWYSSNDDEFFPTHWRPLPEPPARTALEGEGL